LLIVGRPEIGAITKVLTPPNAATFLMAERPAMRTVVHVISDLHLGGAAESTSSAGFQMCRPRTHKLLAGFIEGLPTSTVSCATQLVIAGDIVDFLAEAPFSAFTADESTACDKLASVFKTSKVVWDALEAYVGERRGSLILMLGNHDLELSLPRVRRMLLERIGTEGVSFIYDNEAYSLGSLLIEHGNRFDAWNAVRHSALRRVRSQISRKLPVIPEFPAPPGSRLVVDVLNKVKQDYPFMDLLKPENAAALPLAAALGAVGLQEIWNSFSKFRDQRSIDFDETSAEPEDPDLISGATDTDRELWHVAQAIDLGTDVQEIGGFVNPLRAIGSAATSALQSARIDAVYGAYRKLDSIRRLSRETFDTQQESETYLKPARRSVEVGFKVVVYGHTHLPKRVPLGASTADLPVYLNTGTWADVMCIPLGIWEADERAGRQMFRDFVGDLGTMEVHKWRRTIPTYARIEMDGTEVNTADLLFADNAAPVTTDAVFDRLLVRKEP
jgi:UDP-2,3-diacylglucosamine pyrophosphatase LpxH